MQCISGSLSVFLLWVSFIIKRQPPSGHILFDPLFLDRSGEDHYFPAQLRVGPK